MKNPDEVVRIHDHGEVWFARERVRGLLGLLDVVQPNPNVASARLGIRDRLFTGMPITSSDRGRLAMMSMPVWSTSAHSNPCFESQ